MILDRNWKFGEVTGPDTWPKVEVEWMGKTLQYSYNCVVGSNSFPREDLPVGDNAYECTTFWYLVDRYPFSPTDVNTLFDAKHENTKIWCEFLSELTQRLEEYKKVTNGS